MARFLYRNMSYNPAYMHYAIGTVEAAIVRLNSDLDTINYNDESHLGRLVELLQMGFKWTIKDRYIARRLCEKYSNLIDSIPTEFELDVRPRAMICYKNHELILTEMHTPFISYLNYHNINVFREPGIISIQTECTERVLELLVDLPDYIDIDVATDIAQVVANINKQNKPTITIEDGKVVCNHLFSSQKEFIEANNNAVRLRKKHVHRGAGPGDTDC